MYRWVPQAALACTGLLALPYQSALAHAVCGSRIFPVTLTMDDPGVADEATLPTASFANNSAAGSREYDFNFEYDKRVTENFGFAFNDGWNVYQNAHQPTTTGFEDLVVTAKYATCISPDHEFIAAIGVQREFGGTGTVSQGADAYGTTAPTLYFGKGFGDVPVSLLKPFAVTGELSYTIADKGLKAITTTDPSTGLMSTAFNNGNNNQWSGAMSFQYSLPYLQSQVKDYGLPKFIGNLIPVVEVDWSSSASKPNNQQTTWTVAPGVIYSGDWYSVGVEALIPANKAAGTNVGAIGMFHVFLDDIFPNTLGKPLFNF